MGYSGISHINLREVSAQFQGKKLIGFTFASEANSPIRVVRTLGNDVPDRTVPRGKQIPVMSHDEILSIARELQEEVPVDSIKYKTLQNILTTAMPKKDMEPIIKLALIKLGRLVTL